MTWTSRVIQRAAAGELPPVPRFRGQTRVLDGHPDGEVIQALERVALEAERVVDRIVEEASDAGRARPGGLRFEVQRLTHHAGFPEEIPVKRGAVLVEARAELGDHPETEKPIACDVLVAAQTRRERPGIAASQTHERQNV